MAQDNSIPQKLWNVPSGVDAYFEGRQLRDQHEAAGRNAMLQDRQMKAMDRNEAEDAVKQLAPMIDAWQPGDVAGFEQIKQMGARLGIDPGILGKYTANDGPMLKQKVAQYMAATKQQQFTNDLSTSKLNLDERQFAETQRSNRAGEAIASQRIAQAGAGLSPRVQAAEDEDISAIQTTQSLNAQLGEARRQLESGELELGPINNLIGGAQNYMGVSTPNSRNLAAFQATLEKIRNDSLRLNKGVQTEGDSVRAWNEVTRHINDPKTVAVQLSRIQKLNERAAAQKLQMINVRRSRNGAAGFDPADIAMPGAEQPAAAASGAPAAPAGPSGPKEGDTSMSKSGRSIIFRNGKWQYR